MVTGLTAYIMFGLVFMIYVMFTDEWETASREQIQKYGKFKYVLEVIFTGLIVVPLWLPLVILSIFKYEKEQK